MIRASDLSPSARRQAMAVLKKTPGRTSEAAIANLATSPNRRRNKFGAVKTTVDGLVFDSKKEARRYAELRIAERAGEITRLETQRVFNLSVNGQHVCDYVADFVYVAGLAVTVVEDVKSEATRKNRAYRIKVKLMKAIHGITVREF